MAKHWIGMNRSYGRSRPALAESNVVFCFIVIDSILQCMLVILQLDLFACWAAPVLSGFNKTLCCSKVWSHGWTRSCNVNISPYISVCPFSVSFLSICLFIGFPETISLATFPRLTALHLLSLSNLCHISVFLGHWDVWLALLLSTIYTSSIHSVFVLNMQIFNGLSEMQWFLWWYMCPWSTKAVISNTGIFVAITNNTLYGSKLYIFLLCQKSLGY